jgi:hypothetical protein
MPHVDLTPQGQNDMRIGGQVEVLTLQEVQDTLRIGRRAMRQLIDTDEDFVTLKLGHRRVMTKRHLEEFIQAKALESRPNKK